LIREIIDLSLFLFLPSRFQSGYACGAAIVARKRMTPVLLSTIAVKVRRIRDRSLGLGFRVAWTGVWHLIREIIDLSLFGPGKEAVSACGRIGVSA
jgi:hypothetical protein